MAMRLEVIRWLSGALCGLCWATLIFWPPSEPWKVQLLFFGGFALGVPGGVLSIYKYYKVRDLL
jgi:hypothetical protein